MTINFISTNKIDGKLGYAYFNNQTTKFRIDIYDSMAYVYSKGKNGKWTKYFSTYITSGKCQMRVEEIKRTIASALGID